MHSSVNTDDNKIVYVGLANSNDNIYAYYSTFLKINQVVVALLKTVNLTNDIKKAYRSSLQSFNLNIQYEVNNKIVYIVASETNCPRKKCFDLITHTKNYFESNNNLNPLLYETWLHESMNFFNNEDKLSYQDIVYPNKTFVHVGPSTLLIDDSYEDSNEIKKCHVVNIKYMLLGIFALIFLIIVVVVTAIIIWFK